MCVFTFYREKVLKKFFKHHRQLFLKLTHKFTFLNLSKFYVKILLKADTYKISGHYLNTRWCPLIADNCKKEILFGQSHYLRNAVDTKWCINVDFINVFRTLWTSDERWNNIVCFTGNVVQPWFDVLKMIRYWSGHIFLNWYSLNIQD